MKVAKLGMLGAVAAACITAVATLVPSLLDDDSGGVTTTAVPTTERRIADPPTGNGSVTAVEVDAAAAQVTVQGNADSSVLRVYVMVGPDPSSGTFWTKRADPTDGAWEVSIRVLPGPIPQPTQVSVIFDDGSLFPYAPPASLPPGSTLPPRDPIREEAERIACLDRRGPKCLLDSDDALVIDL